MTLGDELRDLAGELAGAGWRRKFPKEWTPEEEVEDASTVPYSLFSAKPFVA